MFFMCYISYIIEKKKMFVILFIMIVIEAYACYARGVIQEKPET